MPAGPPSPPPTEIPYQPNPKVAKVAKVSQSARFNSAAVRAAGMLEASGQPEMLPWHKRLAVWAVQQYKKPTLADLMHQASKLTHGPVPIKAIRRLVHKPQWKTYCELILADAQAQAKGVMQAEMVKATETHFQAIQRLYEAGEYKDIFRGTVPILDRAWPILDLQPHQARPIINITVHGTQSPENKPVEILEIVEIEDNDPA